MHPILVQMKHIWGAFNFPSHNVVWSGRCHDATQSDIKSAAATAPWTDSSRLLSWRQADCRERDWKGDWAPGFADLLESWLSEQLAVKLGG